MKTHIANRFSFDRRASQICTISCCLFCGLSTSVGTAAVVFDLNADWSDLSNPNGPWSYREGNSVLPHVADWQGLSGDFTGVQPAWAPAETGVNLPVWMKVVSPAGIPNDWQLGDVITHSTDGFNGIGSGPSNVIWTSPFTARIDVAGAIWMGRDINRGNHWDISLNGISLTAGDVFSGDVYSRSAPFVYSAGSGGPAVLQQIPVAAGDVLRLQITKTSEPGDYAGVNLTITATAAFTADFDEDGDVDGDDLVRWRNNFGTGTTHMTGDADADGDADGADYLTWQRQLGSGPISMAADASVAEPASSLLIAFLVTAIVGHRVARSG